MSMIPDESIDVVVSTHVLCSVSDIQMCLSEIFRISVPGGKFYYIEHISYGSDSPFYRFIQRIAEPFWQIFSDGCKLTCDPRDVMDNVHLMNPSSSSSSSSNGSKYKFLIIQQQVTLVPGVYSVMKPHVIGIRSKVCQVD